MVQGSTIERWQASRSAIKPLVLTGGIFIVLLMFFAVYSLIEKILRSGSSSFPSLCPPPLPPATCSDVDMVSNNKCPSDYNCTVTNEFEGIQGCFSVNGKSAPITGSRVNANSEGRENAWTIAHNRRRGAFLTASGEPIEDLEWCPLLEQKAKEIVKDILASDDTDGSVNKRLKILQGNGCPHEGCGFNLFVSPNTRASPERS